MADTACTRALWQAVMGSNPSRFNVENKGGPEHPVERVSWRDIQDFLAKLGTLLPGCTATLPIEAEWEYACRGGTATPFSFGETITPEQVNYNGIYSNGKGQKKGKYRGGTVAVKALPANAWGLYQMHGNVWEWCADSPRKYTGDPQVDPGLAWALEAQAGGKNAASAVRGGSWLNVARFARSALRFDDVRGWRNLNLGFRFALRSKSQAGAPEVLRRDAGLLRRDGAGPAAGRSPDLPPEAASRDATQISGTPATGKRTPLDVPPIDSSLEGLVQRLPGTGRKGFDKK